MQIARTAAIALIVAVTAAGAAAQDFPAGQVVGGVGGDFNRDGNADLALLVAGGDDDGEEARLYIYLRDKDHALLRPISEGEIGAWGNTSLEGLFGQDPSIEARPNGSLVLSSQNSAIGRDRWEKSLTIAWRNDAFVVAGFSYSFYDTLAPDDSGSCDYNVLSGGLVANEARRKTSAKTVALADWDDQIGFDACGFKF